jgi:hypothetical protein
MNRLIKKLKTAQIKYEESIGFVEKEIADKVEFDFSIIWQPSDGFVMCDDDMGNASINDCIKLINEKGFLTYEDYKSHCI